LILENNLSIIEISLDQPPLGDTGLLGSKNSNFCLKKYLPTNFRNFQTFRFPHVSKQTLDET